MKRPRLFPGMIFGLLGLNFVVVGFTLYYAHSDKSFAVEPDYYQKAIAWDQTAAQRERNAQLGWSVAVSLGDVGAMGRRVSIRLADRAGAPLAASRLTLTAFHNARAAEHLTAAVTPDPDLPGAYRADLPLDRPGLWEFRLSATRGQDTFTATVHQDVPGGAR